MPNLNLSVKVEVTVCPWKKFIDVFYIFHYIKTILPFKFFAFILHEISCNIDIEWDLHLIRLTWLKACKVTKFIFVVNVFVRYSEYFISSLDATYFVFRFSACFCSYFCCFFEPRNGDRTPSNIFS